MAAREDQSKALVGNLLHVGSQPLECAQLLGLTCLESSDALPAQPIDRLVACGEDDPARGIVRYPSRWPGAKSLYECVLNSLFGQIEAASRSNQGRDRPSRLATEQEVEVLTCVDRGVSLPVGQGSPEPDGARWCRMLLPGSGHLLQSPRRGLRHPAGSSRRAALSSPRKVHR